MVPKVELPLVTPLTVQVTAVLEVFVTEAVMPKVAFTSTVWGEVGLVIETATAAVMVTLTEADLVESAALVAVMLKVAGDGTDDGAL
jgi:hypothetical protein